MPGFNQQGPWNQGPMTGRGLGPCMAGKSETPGDYAGFPSPMGYGRRCGAGHRPGRWAGPGRGYGWQTSAVPEPLTREALLKRMQVMETELEALKKDLSETGND